MSCSLWSSVQGNCSAKSQVACVLSQDKERNMKFLNSGCQLACQAPSALPYIDTIHGAQSLWGDKACRGDKAVGGQSHVGRGRWDKGAGGGGMWQGHLAQAAYTAPPLSVCPEGTSYKNATQLLYPQSASKDLSYDPYQSSTSITSWDIACCWAGCCGANICDWLTKEKPA